MGQPEVHAEASLTDAFEALAQFWGEAGLDLAEARALAALPAQARPAPTAAAKPQARKPSGPAETAAALAAGAETLEALAAAIAGFEAGPVKAAAKRIVFADGVPSAPVMVIGEGPGKEEEREGKPFVGPSGQLLDRMLASVGLSRTENVFVSNCVFWRQPGDSNPSQQDLAVCLPFLERAIALARPKLLLLVGGVAAQTMLRRSEGVMRLRGKRLSYGEGRLTPPLSAMVILHPAYLLRRPQEKALAWADLQALERWLDELGIKPGRRPY